MKKSLILCVVVMILFLVNVAPIFAASGKAVIPKYHYYTNTSIGRSWVTTYYISNVTGANIHVTLKFYKKPADTAPALLKDSGNSPDTGFLIAADVLNYDETISNASATFDVAPYTTGQFAIMSSTDTGGGTGYGVVEWTQDSEAVVGLVAQGVLQYGPLGYNANIVPSFASISINDGKPF